MNDGTTLGGDCECCDTERFVLVDGNFDDDGMGGAEIARYWGAIMQEMFDYAGLNWTVVYYPDVAGGGFDHDDYIGIHLILPIVEPGCMTGIYEWDPPTGFPRRVVIHGDADGDSAVPYDYGTDCATAIANLGSSKGYAVRIGDDVQDTDAWEVTADDLAGGISGTVSQNESSEVDNGTEIAYTAAVPTRMMAHDSFTSNGRKINWVLAGTPSWLAVFDENVQLLVNMHTVAVA